MKRIKAFALVLAMLLIITGCSPGEEQIVVSGQNEEIGTTVSNDGSSYLNDTKEWEQEYQSTSITENQPVQGDSNFILPENSTFEVHYIDVGQGDSSLILCDGEAMLIDGGEADQSSKIYAYLENQGVDYLDYIVATHAHSDHIGGLSGALNYALVGTALCPVTSYDSKTFNSFEKYLGKQGVP